MHRLHPFQVCWASLLLLSCSHASAPVSAGHVHAAPPGENKPPILFANMGTYVRPVTTESAQAQKFFDQGLNFVYGFNHDEAIRSFAHATELDPTCAMCFWGLAYANGTHINNPVLDRQHAQAAYDAITRAQALASKGSQVEKALISALISRYSSDPASPREPLDKSYADAMRQVAVRHPDDADARALFAEALMNLRPWKLWTHEGKPEPGTEEIVSILESVLAKVPNHPGANHFYIHATEASEHPERALPAADRIGKLVPAAGHLVHMPAHVYIRVGRYGDAASANQRAIAADKAYLAASGQQGFYGMYVAHNHQFLWAASIWSGRYRQAIQAQSDMLAGISPEMVRQMPEMVDFVLPYPYFTLIRFGHWDEMLALPPPPAQHALTTALWHYGRGLAELRKGNLGGARSELATLGRLMPRLANTAVMVLNPPRPLGRIAYHHLAGEMEAAQGRAGEAVRELKEAVAEEDSLNYNEPPDWVLPIRHYLGAVLLAAGRGAEAEAVYREDLRRNPDNGWALRGLLECLRKRGAPEASQVEERFKRAWSVADVALASSRF